MKVCALGVGVLAVMLAGCGAETVGAAASGAVVKQQELKAGQATQQQLQEQLQQGMDLGQRRNAEADVTER